MQSSEEEEKGGENTEDSQEQSTVLGWGEDVIELAYGKSLSVPMCCVWCVCVCVRACVCACV